MSAHLERGVLLFEQNRFAQAEAEFRQLLAAEPDCGVAHSFYALCLSKRDSYKDAISEAELGIRFEPACAFAHHALAEVLVGQNRWKEAATAIEEAIRLDPSDADHHAVLAMVRVQQHQWPAALAAAEDGLRLEPEHVGCTNMRAMVLVKLGRRPEAGSALESALSSDPENALTHANQGWALLHNGERKEAITHFREALRIAPDLEWARAGLVEAMKAGNPIYGLILRFMLLMSRIVFWKRLVILAGAVSLYYGLNELADSYPNLAPYVRPLLIAYMVFALVIIFGSPLFNLLLRFHPTGKHALSPLQKMQSVGMALLFPPAIVAAVWWLATDELLALALAAVLGFTLMSLNFAFALTAKGPRRIMVAYTSALAVAGLGWLLAIHFKDWRTAELTSWVYMIGAMLSAWLAGAMKHRLTKR